MFTFFTHVSLTFIFSTSSIHGSQQMLRKKRRDLCALRFVVSCNSQISDFIFNSIIRKEHISKTIVKPSQFKTMTCTSKKETFKDYLEIWPLLVLCHPKLDLDNTSSKFIERVESVLNLGNSWEILHYSS